MAAGIAPTQSHWWKVEAESVWVNRSPRCRQHDRVSGRVRLARSDADRVLGTGAGCRGGSDYVRRALFGVH